MSRTTASVLVAVPILAAILMAACTTTVPSSSAPVATSSPAASAAPSPSAVAPTPVAPTPVTTALPPTPSPLVTPPAQSDSAWGRLWDVIPPGFPVPPGAVPTEIAEPVSAAFDLPISVSEAATFMQGALEQANFSTYSMSGPLEDGSIVIESVGPTTTDCKVQTSLVPAGGLTRMTVLYGALCPIGSRLSLDGNTGATIQHSLTHFGGRWQ